MAYVDGFVLTVPTDKLPEYKKIARKAGKVWLELGALEYRECVGDDMAPQMGVPFPKLAGAKANETVIFSWIVYKSKADRNRVNKAIMKDPRMAAMCKEPMPFDVNRMSYGGFKTIVDLWGEEYDTPFAGEFED